MITNSASGTNIHEIASGIYRINTPVAIPGTLGFVWAGWRIAGLPPGSLGYVSLLGALLIMPASVLAAPLGVRIAHGISRRKLELAFATFLMLVSVRFLLSL